MTKLLSTFATSLAEVSAQRMARLLSLVIGCLAFFGIGTNLPPHQALGSPWVCARCATQATALQAAGAGERFGPLLAIHELVVCRLVAAATGMGRGRQAVELVEGGDEAHGPSEVTCKLAGPHTCDVPRVREDGSALVAYSDGGPCASITLGLCERLGESPQGPSVAGLGCRSDCMRLALEPGRLGCPEKRPYMGGMGTHHPAEVGDARLGARATSPGQRSRLSSRSVVGRASEDAPSAQHRAQNGGPDLPARREVGRSDLRGVGDSGHAILR